jgi:hypothetical protein
MRQEFAVHILNETGIDNATKLGEAFSTLLDTIDQIIPDKSREKSLVATKLEEASYYAKRAIAQLPVNQKI